MENIIVEIHKFGFVGMATLFAFQSIVLLARGKNNKPRITMGIMEMMWAVAYIMGLLFMFLLPPTEISSVFREKAIIIGSFYISYMLFYLMEVLIPGWLNWKKMLLVLSPILFMIVIYYGGIYLLGETTEDITSYEMLGNSIGHFNVWFRFLFLFTNLVYIGLMLRWLRGFESKYVKWMNDNYADQEYVDISWLKTYVFIIIGITVFYLGVLIFGGRISTLCHSLFVVCSFSYLFYKALFYESPYPQDFFAQMSLWKGMDEILEKEALPLSSDEEDMSEESFASKIPAYVLAIRTWLNEEKPYLYRDFKLTDVARVLPLNRSYLSRVFNEGFGQNFSEVVRYYRVEYAKGLIDRETPVPMHRVAEMSGFNSDTTFIRAFRQLTGETPTQFKNNTESDVGSLL